MDGGPITVICAWCGVLVQEGNENISHGICVPCAMHFLASLPQEYLRSVAEPDGTVTLFSGHRFPLDPFRPSHGAA